MAMDDTLDISQSYASAFELFSPMKTLEDAKEQELVSALANRLRWRPPEQLLSPPIPVCDDIAHIMDKNGVVREIEQARLSSSFRHFDHEFVAGFPKLLLDPASYRAEPSNK